MAIIQTSDFKNRYAITQHPTNIDAINDVISKWEDFYMFELFGGEMFQEYKEGLDLPDPDNKIWVKLRDPFNDDAECKRLIHSTGVKDMLLGFLYWRYYQVDQVKSNATGQVVLKPENSVIVDSNAKNGSIYNQSVHTFRSIQEYVCRNREIYPNYRGTDHRKLLINPFC